MPSSYFSTPSDTLDPALFQSWDNQIKQEVRRPLINAVESSLNEAGLKAPVYWLNLWITGSAISYQWNADRGNGDLDVQIGINRERFIEANPVFRGVDIHTVANSIDSYLKETLWPKMSQAVFDGKTFEVTFFWDYYVSDDINTIHPYAAYDLLKDQWVVRPPSLPVDPESLYPKEWFDSVKEDEFSAARILSVHSDASRELAAYVPGSGNYINAQSRVNLMNAQAKSLYDDIHIGRRQAFTGHGKGYSDYNNFRWQAAKRAGIISNLLDVIHAVPKSDIKSADESLQEAMFHRMGTRYGR
jgi:hypothetical protein